MEAEKDGLTDWVPYLDSNDWMYNQRQFHHLAAPSAGWIRARSKRDGAVHFYCGATGKFVATPPAPPCDVVVGCGPVLLRSRSSSSFRSTDSDRSALRVQFVSRPSFFDHTPPVLPSDAKPLPPPISALVVLLPAVDVPAELSGSSLLAGKKSGELVDPIESLGGPFPAHPDVDRAPDAILAAAKERAGLTTMNRERVGGDPRRPFVLSMLRRSADAPLPLTPDDELPPRRPGPQVFFADTPLPFSVALDDPKLLDFRRT